MSNPVTPETLTDEMIREEWAAALDRGDRDAAKLAQIALGTWAGAHQWQSTKRSRLPACDNCGSNPGDETCHSDAARQRICDVINARAAR